VIIEAGNEIKYLKQQIIYLKRRIKLMRLDKFLAVLLALTLLFTAGSAIAGSPPPEIIGTTSATGNFVFFNYYDIRTMAEGGPGLTDNYFTVTNGSYYTWINAHVRVRTGQCSVELLDFDVLMSPLDVFTFDLYQAPDGETVFASCDTHTLTASGFNVDANGCFILDTGTFPNQLSLIQECGQCPDGTAITAQAALEATRWGYVEVLGEVFLYASDGPDSSASNPTECTTEQLENGEWTAYDFCEATNPGGPSDCYSYADCGPSWDEAYLHGRQYYAMLDGAGNLMRLAQQNGHSWINDDLGLYHRPCYSDNSPGCSSGDGELEADNPTGWAYSAATTSTNPPGANDLNYCFWSNTASSAPDQIVNRNGAAATFGPTLADFHNRGDSNTTTNGLVLTCDHFWKGYPTSHYFYVPGQGETRFVFTFPIQHFLNQTIEITKGARFDTEQNECTLPTQKFISPGLPGPSIARGEVTLIEADEGEACAFNEGWLWFNLATTSDGPSSCGSNCGGPASFIDSEVACTIGSVVNWGDAGTDVMSISPLQYYWCEQCPRGGG
jgi:hypothetical protein